MRKLLFREERSQDVGKLIKGLWDLRRELLKKLGKDTIVKPPRKKWRKAQNGHIDSGSGIDIVQGSNGSGPLLLTTQGCIGSGPK